MKSKILILSGALMLASAAAHANEYAAALQDLANRSLSGWTQDAMIVDAVRARNLETASFSQDQIDTLDQAWRAQIASGGEIIETTLGNALSAHLRSLKDAGLGQYTEIFVTDARGLNVGQSDVTSDYWQGDEAKWQVPTTTGAAHFGDVEFDESSQQYQSQISVPIIDQGSVIGVITVGVNIEQMAAAN